MGNASPKPIQPNPYELRMNILNQELKETKLEQSHWENVIQNFKEYDNETYQCLCFISYWIRCYKYQSTISIIKTMNESINLITNNIILPYYRRNGIFNHSIKDQYKAKQLWAKERLKSLNDKLIKIENIKNELIKYKDNLSNVDNKIYWKCNRNDCNNCNIMKLWIENKSAPITHINGYSYQYICYKKLSVY